MPEISTVGEPHFWETLQYLIGFVLVIGVLVFLWMLTALIGYLFERDWGGRGEPAGRSSGAAAAGRPIDPTTLAVIAAAVHSVYEDPVRVIAVRRASTDSSTEGRRQISASHRVR